MKEETAYLIHLRWYNALNYLVALAEQIALWKYGFHTFFWWALALNILTAFSLATTISKLENKILNN